MNTGLISSRLRAKVSPASPNLVRGARQNAGRKKTGAKPSAASSHAFKPCSSVGSGIGCDRKHQFVRSANPNRTPLETGHAHARQVSRRPTLGPRQSCVLSASFGRRICPGIAIRASDGRLDLPVRVIEDEPRMGACPSSAWPGIPPASPCEEQSSATSLH